MSSVLPPYDSLPSAEHGGRSGWGVFGGDDRFGLLNLLTEDRTRAASELIRRGRVFALNTPIDFFQPALDSGRGEPAPRLLHEDDWGTAATFDDVVDNYFLQISSQWDSLGHVAYYGDAFYNGRSSADVKSGMNAIADWAERGIAGRAVLVDMARDRAHVPGEPAEAIAYSPEDIEAVRRRQGVEYTTGSILLLRTGFISAYRDLGEVGRQDLAGELRAPGIEHTEAMARYLWDHQICAVASDTFAVEVWPPDLRPETAPFGFLHQMLIGQFGMALGELWDLDELAADCAADNVYEGFLASAPLNLRPGVGSPSNALIVK